MRSLEGEGKRLFRDSVNLYDVRGKTQGIAYLPAVSLYLQFVVSSKGLIQTD